VFVGLAARLAFDSRRQPIPRVMEPLAVSPERKSL
jgi:hypothetical protein